MSYSRALFDGEGEFEGEAFANPQRRLGPQALMERLGREAAQALPAVTRRTSATKVV